MNCHPTSRSQLSVDLKAASARLRSQVKRHRLSNYCRDVLLPRYHVRIDTRLSSSFPIFRRGEGRAWERGYRRSRRMPPCILTHNTRVGTTVAVVQCMLVNQLSFTKEKVEVATAAKASVELLICQQRLKKKVFTPYEY